MGQIGADFGQLEHEGRGGDASYRTPPADSAAGSVNRATPPDGSAAGSEGVADHLQGVAAGSQGPCLTRRGARMSATWGLLRTG